MHTFAAPAVLLAAIAAASLSFAATAQTAQVIPYGVGCSWNGTPLAIGVQGAPQIGTTFTIDYSGPNLSSTLSTQPVLVLGTAPDGTTIPVTFLPQQPGGCFVWVQPLLFAAMPGAPTGGFVTSQDVAVPNDATLLGLQFFAQWMATVVQCGFAPPCSLEALPTSDAVQLIVGL